MIDNRIVITGATGFVGRSLTRELVRQGETVNAVVRPTSDQTKLADLPIQFITADVTDPHSLRGIFDGATLVIHAAGMLGQAGVPEAIYHQLHVDGTRHILNEMVSMGQSAPRLLYISSPGVLGVTGLQIADEKWPYNPTNPYERSKAAAEKVVKAYVDKIDLVIARPEFIYGPDDTHVLGLFKAIKTKKFIFFNGGREVCHPTYIDDAVQGLLKAAKHGKRGEIYHIAGQHPVSFRQLSHTIAHHLAVKPPKISVPRSVGMLGAAVLEALPITPPLSRTGVAFFSESRRFSWQKAHEHFNYTPHISLDEGVRRTIDYYQANHLL